MLVKQFRIRDAILLAGLTVTLYARAAGFFEGRDLDFWREGKRVAPAAVQTPWPGQPPLSAPSADELPPPSGSIIRQRDALPFDWSRYEDPAHPEFWDDGGDYVAPRPLREAVANPTKENLERYLAWQARRLAVVASFSEKLAAHALGVSPGGARPVPSGTAARVDSRKGQSSPEVNWREVDVLYFYQSSCPHCLAEREHIEDLARRGARVSFIQLDASERPPLHAGSIAYTKAHSEQFGITATPTWILRRREKSVRLQGRQEESALRAKVASLFTKSPTGEGP